MSEIILTPNMIEKPDVEETIIVVRTPEQFARAVMAAGEEFGKIHKNPHNDPFIIRKRR